MNPEEILEPLGNRVLVKPFPPKDKSAGGVALPDQAQMPSQRGRVEAVGPEAQASLLDSVVVYSKYAGMPVEAPDAEMLLMLNEGDVLGVIRPKP